MARPNILISNDDGEFMQHPKISPFFYVGRHKLVMDSSWARHGLVMNSFSH